MNGALPHRQYGNDQGRWLIYFHGAPGDPSECELFEPHAKRHGVKVVCFQRFAIDSALNGPAYFQRLAEAIVAKTGGEPVDWAGFSIGAFVALQVAALMSGQVRSMHLISAAGPLTDRRRLQACAGKQVFRLARAYPVLFRQLCIGQGIAARLWPTAVMKGLFAEAGGRDRQLIAQPKFRTTMSHALQASIGHYPKAYARDILLYVQPWQDLLAVSHVPTTLWHGEQDTWAPIAMADDLRRQLPGFVGLHRFADLAHYTCLHTAAESVCRQVGHIG